MKTLSKITVTLGMAGLIAYAPAWAKSPTGASPDSPEAVITKTLASLPQMPSIVKVTRLPYSTGIYEVTLSSNETIYTNEKAEFVMLGVVIDFKQFKEYMSKSDEWSRIMEVKNTNAFVYRKGNGAREIAVFSDPNCPYCKKFEEELLKLDNITIYYFPVKFLNNSRFPDMVERIWCAEDRLAAWRNWMLKGTMPPRRTCDTSAIEHNSQLARSIGVSGVPSVYQKEGLVGTGASSWQEVEKRLPPAR